MCLFAGIMLEICVLYHYSREAIVDVLFAGIVLEICVLYLCQCEAIVVCFLVVMFSMGCALDL